MNNTQPQPHNESREENIVLESLTQSPDTSEIKDSFVATMETVTKLPPVRIHTQTPRGSHSISTYFMNHAIKIITGAAIFVFVLIGGYHFYSEPTGEYDDIYAAALLEEEAYVIEIGADDFADLEESSDVEDIATLVAIADTEAADSALSRTSEPVITTPTADIPDQNTESLNDPTSDTEDIEAALSALDALFSTDDDVDDSDLADWFSDTSAGDSLNQSYEL